MKKNKMNKTTIVIIVMAVLLVVAIGYVGYDVYSEAQMVKQAEIYQIGASYGYEQAVTTMFQQAGSCQQVPLTINNQTINIVAVECLQNPSN